MRRKNNALAFLEKIKEHNTPQISILSPKLFCTLGLLRQKSSLVGSFLSSRAVEACMQPWVKKLLGRGAASPLLLITKSVINHRRRQVHNFKANSQIAKPGWWITATAYYATNIFLFLFA